MKFTVRRLVAAATLVGAALAGSFIASTPVQAAAPVTAGHYWSGAAVEAVVLDATPVTDGRYWSTAPTVTALPSGGHVMIVEGTWKHEWLGWYQWDCHYVSSRSGNRYVICEWVWRHF